MIYEKEGLVYNMVGERILAKAVIKDIGNSFEYINTLMHGELHLVREYDYCDDCSDEEILMECEDDFEFFYEYQKKLSDKKVVFLDYIENVSGVRSSASEMVKHLKNKYEAIMLYSTSEAEKYWENNDFVNFYDGYYIYMR